MQPIEKLGENGLIFCNLLMNRNVSLEKLKINGKEYNCEKINMFFKNQF